MIITTTYQGVTFSAEVTPAAEIRDWWRFGPKQEDEYQVEFLSVVTDVDGWEYVYNGSFDYEQFHSDTEMSFSDLHDAAIAARFEYECEPPTVDLLLLLK